MPILGIENWSVKPGVVNAWVKQMTHDELQKIMPDRHTGKHNSGAPNGGAVRNRFYEYILSVEKITECPIVDGWYFTSDRPGLEEFTFTMAFHQRKQNPNYPIQTRAEVRAIIPIA